MSRTPLWTVAEVAHALGLSGDFPNTAIASKVHNGSLMPLSRLAQR